MPDGHHVFLRRLLILATMAVAMVGVIGPTAALAQGKKPNIVVIFGDDIGQSDISAYSFGLMGFRTPYIDRLAREGMMFTDYYAEQSCTAGRSTFISGQVTLRTGLSKVGVPGARVGLQKEDITIAEALKPLGYATAQFGKNHLGDRDEYLPTVHGLSAAAAAGELHHRSDHGTDDAAVGAADRSMIRLRRWARRPQGEPRGTAGGGEEAA